MSKIAVKILTLVAAFGTALPVPALTVCQCESCNTEQQIEVPGCSCCEKKCSGRAASQRFVTCLVECDCPDCDCDDLTTSHLLIHETNRVDTKELASSQATIAVLVSFAHLANASASRAHVNPSGHSPPSDVPLHVLYCVWLN